MVIHGIHEDMTMEQIAYILGGGWWVRSISLMPNMAFVTYWTEKGQQRGIKDGPDWIREEGWTAKQAEACIFNPKFHMYEIDRTAPQPPFFPFPKREDIRDGTEESDQAGSWTKSSTTTTTEYWHEWAAPRPTKKRKPDIAE